MEGCFQLLKFLAVVLEDKPNLLVLVFSNRV